MLAPEQKILAIIAGFAIFGSLSFYAGMEYQSYRIAKNISDAFGSFGDVMNNATSETKPEAKSYTVVNVGSTHTMSGSKDGDISVSVGSAQVGKKEIKEDYMVYTAKNSYTTVDITVENTGKTPNFLSVYDARLVLADGTTYESVKSTQIKGCVGCSLNPGSKETESILFDVDLSSEKLNGAKLEIDNVQFIIK